VYVVKAQRDLSVLSKRCVGGGMRKKKKQRGGGSAQGAIPSMGTSSPSPRNSLRALRGDIFPKKGGGNGKKQGGWTGLVVILSNWKAGHRMGGRKIACPYCGILEVLRKRDQV